jgi:hypothetical protein
MRNTIPAIHPLRLPLYYAMALGSVALILAITTGAL